MLCAKFENRRPNARELYAKYLHDLLLRLLIGEESDDVQTYFSSLYIFCFVHFLLSMHSAHCRTKLIRKAHATGFESIPKTYRDQM